jgi:hypothetical protein
VVFGSKKPSDDPKKRQQEADENEKARQEHMRIYKKALKDAAEKEK